MNLLLWLADLKELWIALVGAIVGGLFTMWATHLTQKGELNRAAQERREEKVQIEAEHHMVLANTAKLILVEITTAWNVYRDEYAADLMQLPDGVPYLCVFPVGENSFPIFDSAPTCLAQLPTETAQLIVRFFMRAKGLIAMVNMNNIDTERAREYANAELQKRSSQALLSVQLENAEDINTSYVQDAKRMASLIGMGSTADGMKGLTLEIETLVLDLQARLVCVD
ncbi:hypothetical protein [Pseudomonas syringae]|uniref:hypothetical protein n=1 Tax=Pseudomonas syringae TaxID=317 RepID=UPI0018E60B26|nr:hypothetical protein [Pseudomonas syringae]MBI6781612.1 hypothetical protein [Pseudomonas syringae]